nr:hypothetical protein [Tanacetum cinerariifolium]
MVNTRNNNFVLNTPPPTDSIQAALAAIQENLANIQAKVRVHLTEIANLKRGERTSQPRTDELIAQPRPHPEPNNTPYGKLIRIEFPKFSGDDVKDWEHFKVEVVKRFGVLYDDPIMELKNLKQTGSVQTYQEAFEALLNRVDLPELVAVSHKCSGQLHSIEVICGDDFDNYIDGDDETYQDCVGDMVGVTDSSQITLNSLSGLNSYQTMRVRGRVGKQVVHILIDCGSTHNFLDIHTAKKLGCRLAKTTPMQVSVANGQGMMSTFVCHDLKWSLQNEVFTSDVMLLPPDGCEIVLGIQWMYIDYRQLNKHTVKDKFPIPVIEELIDEFNGSVVFFKLDLSLMNTIFKAFLKKFVLVFFDDILIYNKNLEEHCDYLAQFLQVMKDNTLYAKRTKCYFDVSQVEYLGHIISAQGVSIDPSKIEDMQKWPIPSTLKQLRGFLGLTGYYRRFIKDYASISQPLVALTNKDAFKWNPSAELAYHKLKKAMVKAPVLALPNFEQEFVVETDASGKGIGAVLCQNVAALDKWKGYLLDRHFKIRTNHFSLKYLLNQKLTTLFQFKWLPKLLGYDYKTVYKKGSENVVADVLSRMDSSGELLQISVSFTGGILKRKGKVVVGNDPELRKELVQHFHDGAIGGHSVYKLHGLPASIVSDRDKVFLSNFWKALFAKLKLKLKLSTAYHPQTNGQTEVVNRSLGCYLRCMCGEKPKGCVKWLSLAEVWYNTNYHTSTKTTPYEAVYCQTPPIHVPYIPGDSRVEEVDRTIQAREGAIKVLKFHLKSVTVLPQLREDGLLENKPMAILERRLGKVNNKPVMFVIIQWTNKPVEEATWEIYGDLITRFSRFDAVNEVFP